MACINIKRYVIDTTITKILIDEIKWIEDMIGYNWIKLNWLNGQF